VSFEAWIFAIHLLMAATLVGALVMSWILTVALRSVETAGTTLSFNRVAMVGATILGVGLVGVIAFGIWLAILRDAFHPWDGWVIAAIILWVIATAAIMRAVAEYRKPAERARALLTSGQTGPDAELAALNRTTTALLMRALASAAIVLIVIDMVYKPGA
jgi:hypothetical protein